MSTVPRPRKLLVASIGLATISYVGCGGGGGPPTSGNLMVPICADGSYDYPCEEDGAGGQGGTGGVGGDGGTGGVGGVGGNGGSGQ